MTDRNDDVTLLTSVARIAAGEVNSEKQINRRHRGLHVVIDVTADPASASVVPHIQAFDDLSQKWYDLLVGNAIIAVGTTVLKVYPGITASAAVSASDILPALWRLQMVHADTDSITYSAAGHLVS